MSATTQFTKQDDHGVTSVEYAALIGFLALLVIPFMIAAYNALWSGNSGVAGISASLETRGPYSYPDGDVPLAKFLITGSPGSAAYSFPKIHAANGYLYVDVAAKDRSNGRLGEIVSTRMEEGTPTQVYVPQTGGTVWISALPRGSSAPLVGLPAGFNMSGYVPSVAWSCGC